LAELEPDNTTFLRDLSVSFVRMGGLDERTDPAKARQLYLKGLEIAERLATLEPDNNTFLHDLSVFFGRMGGLDERRDPAKAREWYLKGLDIRQRLAALEPDNTTFLCDLSISCVNLGELALRLGCDDPGVWFDRAIPIRRTLVAQEPEDADLWERLARACHLRGAWGLRQNRGDEHGGFRDECFQALDRAEVIASPTAQTGYLRACACALAGDSQAALAALAQAVERGYDDADEALDERDLETLRSDPRFQELIAEMRRRRSGSVLRS
jgi:tetratricopeptide (TPR) repeat protein